MNLYRILNWDKLYENNRTRELKKLDWIPIPNKQDGDGYTLIMEHPEGASIFGAWIACAQIASRCDPRGTLLRDGKKPHDSASLSRISRVPVKIIETMLSVVSSPDINWLEIIDMDIHCEITALSRDIAATGCLEGKGKKEGNGRESNPSHFPEQKIPSWDEWSLACSQIGVPEWRAKDEFFKQQARDTPWKDARLNDHARRVLVWWQGDGSPKSRPTRNGKSVNLTEERPRTPAEQSALAAKLTAEKKLLNHEP